MSQPSPYCALGKSCSGPGACAKATSISVAVLLRTNPKPFDLAFDPRHRQALALCQCGVDPLGQPAVWLQLLLRHGRHALAFGDVLGMVLLITVGNPDTVLRATLSAPDLRNRRRQRCQRHRVHRPRTYPDRARYGVPQGNGFAFGEGGFGALSFWNVARKYTVIHLQNHQGCFFATVTRIGFQCKMVSRYF